MDAVRYYPKKAQLTLQRVEIPTIAPDEVLVEVAYSNVCGTDLHIVQGQHPVRPDGVTLGHEFSGIVHQVGSNVKHVKKGDPVAVDPNGGCDTCHHCGSGNYHLCTDGPPLGSLGTLADGGWATFCKAPARQVFKLPDGFPLEFGAFIEPMSCLYHGLDLLGPVPMGSNILVMGAGIIGLLWLNAFHVQGHRRIVVVEKSESRLNIVKGMGLAAAAITPEELVPKYKDNKFRVVVDCSGSAKAMEVAMDLLLPGGTLMIFGLAHPEAKMDISPFQIYKNELSIIGIFTNSFTFPKAMGIIESFGRKYMDFNKMGIKVFSLNQYKEAIQAITDRSISKATFKIK